MKLNCLHCSHEFEGTITKDALGWHSSCPKCGASFDVDVPKGKIIMAFASDDTEEYFTDEWCDENEIVSYYAFDTPAEFFKKWQTFHDYKNGGSPDSMWYWVLDDGELVCSGACDPNDEDTFEEFWGDLLAPMKNVVFTLYRNMENVKDSMEIDSDTYIAAIDFIGTEKCATVVVKGEVNVWFDDEHFTYASQFPEELMKLFRNGTADYNERVDISNNNWFETFATNEKGENLPMFNDIVNIEGCSAEDIYSLLAEAFEELPATLDEFIALGGKFENDV